ncbi:hypothetical protein MKX03_002340 [Papaver bracteatum]|nr:hypothetical protein MKX03_002340 [Papaver bracteatum]
MHDLVHDLAQSVAKTECSIKYVNKIEEEEITRLRRVNLVLGNKFTLFPYAYSKIKKLRTLICTTPTIIDNAYAMQICKNFKCVRVLDLRGSAITELPPSIGKLKHLSDVSSFPSLEELSIRGMHQLLDWSDHISSSSTSSSSFPRLVRLSITDCRNLRSMPTRFPSRNEVSFKSSNGKPISPLIENNLSSLSTISISTCEEFVFLPYTLLRGNNILTYLRISTCGNFEGFIRNQDVEDKEEAREFQNQVVILNTGLHTLIVNHCPAFNCPLDVLGFNSLRMLSIMYCSKSQKCIPSGIQYLPKLQYLRIGPLSEELDSFPFPAPMVNEEGIVIGDYFPSLLSIIIAGWSNLQGIPDDLQYINSLQELRIWDYPSLVALPRRRRENFKRVR